MSARVQPRTAPLPPEVPGARWVRLTQGRFALVDEIDYVRVLAAGTWCFNRKTGYAFRMRPRAPGQKRGAVLLHRFIMNEPPGLVDHENRNRLDCRRFNLRRATSQESAWNRGKTTANTTGYKGVYRNRKGEKPFRAVLNLGSFATAEEAARAYDDAARRQYGTFAALNFPPPRAAGTK